MTEQTTQEAVTGGSSETLTTGSSSAGTGAVGTGQTATAGTLTQEQVDEIVRKRLAREQARAGEREAALQAELQQFRQAEQERRRAEMTEIERVRAEADEARRQAAEATTRLEEANLATLRAYLISLEGPDLPPEYKAQVSGSDEDSIRQSIGELQGSFAAARQRWLADLAALNVEQITEQYGEPGQALVEKLGGRPASIGAPSKAGGQPTPAADYGPDNPSDEAWLRERARRGYPSW